MNYASVFGLLQPAAASGRANQAPTYLPTDQNYKIVNSYVLHAWKKQDRPCSTEASLIHIILCQWWISGGGALGVPLNLPFGSNVVHCTS